MGRSEDLGQKYEQISPALERLLQPHVSLAGFRLCLDWGEGLGHVLLLFCIMACGCVTRKVSNSALEVIYKCSENHEELVPCSRGTWNAARAVSSHLGPKSHCVTSTQSDESARHQSHASKNDRLQSNGMCQTYLAAVMNCGAGLVSSFGGISRLLVDTRNQLLNIPVFAFKIN